ncbi:hypothetical protein [Clostridium perfringens]|uniref:hypothetical protein n=1 Tax=Clostridium perfringens TaxID=1502 RepID=UPI002443A421|nr:hypothetical protein [Clostridium perfringens]MDG6891192.1 hypothetical protein [Clostridium perfringens]
MIIVKEYKRKNKWNGSKQLISLAFYERKSFRVEGKVKKKDYYLMTLTTYEIDKLLKSDLKGLEEFQKIKDAIIKYNNKQAKKLEKKRESEWDKIIREKYPNGISYDEFEKIRLEKDFYPPQKNTLPTTKLN